MSYSLEEEFDRSENLHLQLTERDAHITSLSDEICRLNEQIRKKNSALEEASVLTDTFPGWVEMYFSSQPGVQDAMIAQKKRDLTRFSALFREARHG